MKKCFLVIPHQDDEINLAGNILDRLAEAYELYVIYSSLDTRLKERSIRRQEALAACGFYGIDKEHIIFLSYPDMPNKFKHHFYTSGDKRIIEDLKKLIVELRPELIIGTDFDFHSDHRMLSLALDTAISHILMELDDYRPILLKGFCYETAYYGVEDYSASFLGKCRVSNDILANSSFEWENRLSLSGNLKEGFIWNKKAYKALKKHKSQYAVLHARSILNSDNVYWQKRTDNLLFKKETSLTVTSGDGSKLRDFLVIDTDDIITLNPREIDYSKAVWVPDKADLNPAITISFMHANRISHIILHGNPNDQQDLNTEIMIKSEHKKVFVKTIAAYGRDTVINIGDISTNEVQLVITAESFHGLSEIEIFSEESGLPEDFMIKWNTDEESVPEKKAWLIDQINNYGYYGIVLAIKLKRKSIMVSNINKNKNIGQRGNQWKL